MRFHVAFLGWIVVASCGPGARPPEEGEDPGVMEGCLVFGDEDADGIANGIEGCEAVPPRDSDDDGEPDWLDLDSDGDGVGDGDEDRDGNGVLGTCETGCTSGAGCPAEHACTIPEGQSEGVCVSWFCADGETLPTTPDTDGDGVRDDDEGTFVCNQPGELEDGLKPIRYIDSADVIMGSMPDWRIAVEPGAVEGLVTIAGPELLDSAYLVTYPEPMVEVAGFLVTRRATGSDGDAAEAVAAAMFRLGMMPSATLSVRASGTRGTTLDGHDTVRGTVLLVTTTVPMTPNELRRLVVPALMDRAPGDLSFPAVPWTGEAATTFALHFQTQRREAVGSLPTEALYMGAVTTLAAFEDREAETGFRSDDLANGTALTFSRNGEEVECEPFVVTSSPTADIIWVDDESITMQADRENVAANATAFFDRATLAGVDFRMGITEIDDAKMGLFALRDPASSSGDRWIHPGELSLFQQYINDPSGADEEDCCREHGLTVTRMTLERHLPRDDTDAARIRENAAAVVILMTDERPQELEEADIFNDGGGSALMSSTQASQVADLVSPLVTFLDENEVVFHLMALPEGGDCGSEIGYGYFNLMQATGGEFGSICQTDLGPTIDNIIELVIGQASPVVLDYVPISASISVSRDGVAIARSRSHGWDYRAASNSIIFNGMPFDPTDPAEIVVSYRRWAEQVPID